MTQHFEWIAPMRRTPFPVGVGAPSFTPPPQAKKFEWLGENVGLGALPPICAQANQRNKQINGLGPVVEPGDWAALEESLKQANAAGDTNAARAAQAALDEARRVCQTAVDQFNAKGTQVKAQDPCNGKRGMGAEVLQEVLNERLAAMGKTAVSVDGNFGPASCKAWMEAFGHQPSEADIPEEAKQQLKGLGIDCDGKWTMPSCAPVAGPPPATPPPPAVSKAGMSGGTIALVLAFLAAAGFALANRGA